MKKMLYYLLLIVVILFISLELYLRFLTNYCDPHFDKNTKIIKRRANREGIYKTKHTSSGYFRINNEGWNSHRDYFRNPDGNQKQNEGKKKIRLAVVGHSNIEGLRVPVEKMSSKILENKLLENGIDAEVYTFGYGGMHLAQALHVSGYVVENFRPDILLIGTLSDDFLFENTSKPNFLSLQISENEQVKEVIPLKYRESSNSPLSMLYFSKAVKYADIKLELGRKLKTLFIQNDSKRTDAIQQTHYSMLKISKYEKKVLTGINYIMEEFHKLSNCEGISLQIYFISFPESIPSFNYLKINYPLYLKQHHKKIIDFITDNQFPVINLEQAFSEDYKKNKQNFDFSNDGHYNQHAHEVIGKYLAKYFIDNKILK